jgi:Protein of unknown function (DUF4199)
MEQQSTSTASIALKWGVVGGVASIIFTTILYVSGQATNTPLGLLGLIISATCIFLAMKEFRTENSGFMSYGQGLGVGTLLTAVSGFMSMIFNYIYTEFIDTTIRQQILDKMRSDMEGRGMDDIQIDQAMEMSQKFASPGFTFVFGIIGAIFIGFVISLIISAILKKNKPFEY